MDFLFLCRCFWRMRNDVRQVSSSRFVHGAFDCVRFGVRWFVQRHHDPVLERWLRPAAGQLPARPVSGIPGWCARARSADDPSAVPDARSGQRQHLHGVLWLPDGRRVWCALDQHGSQSLELRLPHLLRWRCPESRLFDHDDYQPCRQHRLGPVLRHEGRQQRQRYRQSAVSDGRLAGSHVLHPGLAEPGLRAVVRAGLQHGCRGSLHLHPDSG